MLHASWRKDKKSAIMSLKQQSASHLVGSSLCIRKKSFRQKLMAMLICSLILLGIASRLFIPHAKTPPFSFNSMTIFSNTPTKENASSINEQYIKCKARDLGYQSMHCPRWDASADNSLVSNELVDYRVRYLWKKQHPSDCSKVNYQLQKVVDNGLGFGAMMHGYYLGPFMGAIRSDRVFIRDKDFFTYSGCNDKTWSCYFEPITNCSYESDVLPILESHPNAQKEWNDWKNGTHRVVQTDNWKPSGHYPPYRGFDDFFNPHGHEELEVGAFLYLMRLNTRTQQEVEQTLRETIPCDLDPRRTISLPIRASDKCIGEYHLESGLPGESSCPDFNTYMELCEIIRENDPMVDTIILTSEDARFIEPRHAYTTARGNRKPWRFILNSRDVMQGGGTMQVITNNTVHEVFMSFFTTMQMQLRGRYLILNCSSKFHTMIRYLVMGGGCGFVQKPIIICMDEQASRFQICTKHPQQKYERCMDAKLPEDERIRVQKEREAKKLEEQQRKDEDEKKRQQQKDQPAAKKANPAASFEEPVKRVNTASDSTTDEVKKTTLGEHVKRRLSLDLKLIDTLR